MDGAAEKESGATDADGERVAAPESWEVRGSLRASREIDAWAAALQETHVAFDVKRSDNTPAVFHGTITRRKLGDLHLVDCDSLPWQGRNELGDGQANSESVVGVQVVRRGSETYRDGSRSAISRVGDIKIWASWDPVTVEALDRFAKRTLIIPLERMLAACPRLSSTNVLPQLQSDPATRLLGRYIDLLASELPSLSGAAGAAAGDAALELLRAAIEPGMPSSKDAKRLAMRTEIRRYVRSHLQDPLLDPSSIAAAHAMSVRVLHVLFEGSGESVAGLIRRERLARCWDDLERPTGGAVTEIAFRWGYKDSAHFARAFKREFGISPSEVRRAALRAQE